LEKVKLDRKSPSARDLHVEFGQRPSTTQNPTRISYWIEDDQISVSAITETATVAKRVLRFDRKILDEVIQQMEDPDPQALQQLSQFLGKLMVPQEFRELVRDPDRPLVLEVDRDMAPVHWEMIGDGVTSMEPIALRRSVSRQLRTTYSPPPRPEQRQGQLRALIIGDPGDPDIGDDLPGAREEARAVARIFEEKGVETRVLIGAPRHRGGARISGIEPASRTEVMRILLTEEFDILHYSGHGDFDPKDPTKVGWVFKGGLLTARELERVDRVPQLVFANACLSGLTSNRGVPGVKDPEQALLPSLADEFFKRGVHDYVGSAWVVDDVGAVDFATAFYEELLRAPGDNRQAKTIGAAMLAARKAISTREDCLWAAYQHYGDPELVLRSFSK
jgi:CHAT domain-containing protein